MRAIIKAYSVCARLDAYDSLRSPSKRGAAGQRGAIARAVRQDDRLTGTGYLTKGEKQYVIRHLELLAASVSVECLMPIAIQPYNFATWKPGFLAQLGMVNYELPAVVPVKVQSRLADVSNVHISANRMIARKLRGYDGAYVNGSMAFASQAVVWSNRTIVQF